MSLATILLIAQIISAIVGGANGFVTLASGIMKQDPSLPLDVNALGEHMVAGLKAVATSDALDVLKNINADLHAKALEILSGQAA